MAPGPRTGRPGRWHTMHVRIAWQIHHHKLRVKQKMQVDSHAISFGIKPELLTQPPGPDLIQAIHHQRDLIQSSTPLSNPDYPTDNTNAPSGEVGGTPEWWSRQQKTPPKRPTVGCIQRYGPPCLLLSRAGHEG
ncbi:autism susceptibility gene 2 protein-like [Coregonus clupeaformis]|uniref:autism susceptibility gene 2 protein-like n=1 Tax=Coregonus clupeaformis TaxID=59861 RepID=UPI001BE1064A|nr:autism susceptibility gene 2 protein-like [Coregonus clupeaformis]